MANQNSSVSTIKPEEKSSKNNSMSREVTMQELAQHNKPTDAWIAVKGKSEFLYTFLFNISVGS